MIIRHKPRHGDNKPRTQETAQTHLETQVGLSPAWVHAQDSRTAQYAPHVWPSKPILVTCQKKLAKKGQSCISMHHMEKKMVGKLLYVCFVVGKIS